LAAERTFAVAGEFDSARLPGVDVVHDINQLPLPFQDSSFDEILCCDILEHVDLIPVLQDCHRILANGGSMTIEVPHFSSNNNFVDPTHRNRFSVKTFRFFVKNTFEGPAWRLLLRISTSVVGFDAANVQPRLAVLLELAGFAAREPQLSSSVLLRSYGTHVRLSSDEHSGDPHQVMLPCTPGMPSLCD
jgi:SAM-dependent methyltransferase